MARGGNEWDRLLQVAIGIKPLCPLLLRKRAVLVLRERFGTGRAVLVDVYNLHPLSFPRKREAREGGGSSEQCPSLLAAAFDFHSRAK